MPGQVIRYGLSFKFLGLVSQSEEKKIKTKHTQEIFRASSRAPSRMNTGCSSEAVDQDFNKNNSVLIDLLMRVEERSPIAVVVVAVGLMKEDRMNPFHHYFKPHLSQPLVQ